MLRVLPLKQCEHKHENITWLRLCDDVGLTNQVWALKTGSGIQKCRRAVRLPFQSTFKWRSLDFKCDWHTWISEASLLYATVPQGPFYSLLAHWRQHTHQELFTMYFSVPVQWLCSCHHFMAVPHTRFKVESNKVFSVLVSSCRRQQKARATLLAATVQVQYLHSLQDLLVVFSYLKALML